MIFTAIKIGVFLRINTVPSQPLANIKPFPSEAEQ